MRNFKGFLAQDQLCTIIYWTKKIIEFKKLKVDSKFGPGILVESQNNKIISYPLELQFFIIYYFKGKNILIFIFRVKEKTVTLIK